MTFAMGMEKTLSEEYFVSANEANAQRELAAHILVSNIIDTATAHANALHIGNPDMEETGGGWVLSRLTIEMERWPKVNESYRLTTWIESYNRRFSERAFRVEDCRGETIGYARTVWMVIDTATHRSLGLSHLPLAEEYIDGSRAPIERQARQAPIFAAGEECPAAALTATADTRGYTFRYCDIDFYRHVNTVRYIVLLLNQFTLEQMDSSRLRRLELSFMQEAVYGMTVDIMRHDHEDGGGATFTLCPQGDHAHPLLFARLFMRQCETT